jgi:hypothetical protein
MVSVLEESDLKGLGDVIFGAIGLTGAITLGALAFGLVLAVVIIWYRKLRASWEPEEKASQTQQLGLTAPTPQATPRS